MKRLLVITYYWPPVGGSGVQRWVKFCKYLPESGWQPVIYTPENPEHATTDETLLKDIPSEVEVIRTRINEPYSIYRRIFGKKETESVTPLNSGRKSWKQKISIWIRGNFFVPDPRVWWVRPSVRFLKKYLQEHPVDAIVTTGPPQSMHLIGLALKKATGVRWLADFRDPWTQAFYFKNMGAGFFARRRHSRLERQVLDNADTIISVSPTVREDFQKMTATPVVLITNGYDEDDGKVAPLDKGDRFVIAHTGQFASDGNPVELWRSLRSLCERDPLFSARLQIRLSGQVDPAVVSAIRGQGLGDNLVLVGYIPHSQVISEQKAADILLLPLRNEPEGYGIVPGKIFEYIASGRPVLGFGQTDGAAAGIIRHYRAGKMLEWNDGAGTEAFVGGVWRGEPNECGTVDTSSCSRRALTKELVKQLLKNLL